MKAYGIKLWEINSRNRHMNGVSGICVREDGEILGYWFSSNDDFLAKDLANHAKQCAYEYVGINVPESLKHILLKDGEE